jgi:hypothetical protein
MAVGGDQVDAAKAAGDQATQERQPAGAVLTAGHVQAEDLTLAVGVDPTASSACTRTVRPSSRTFSVKASSQTKVDGPASSGRFRNAATCLSRLLAISLTCDFDSRVTPRVSTSFSTRRVDTPAGSWSLPP